MRRATPRLKRSRKMLSTSLLTMLQLDLRARKRKKEPLPLMRMVMKKKAMTMTQQQQATRKMTILNFCESLSELMDNLHDIIRALERDRRGKDFQHK
mmetsp:Transcript_19577/g.35225  ORF Transcript_19577/g.35225 Transcript_19577/m.35225 type:complete len:97 (+) Transcript_19577:2400-2690(+)